MRRLLAILLIAVPLAAQTSDEFAKAVFFGKKFFDIHDYASSYDQFAKADQLQPDNPAVVYNMAVVLAKAGRYSEAQAQVDRYGQLFPNGAERPMIAKLQLELDFQRELQKKRQAEQSYVDLFNRGKFAWTRNDLDAALKIFQEAEQQRPSDAAAVFNQAVIHERLGDLAKAAERFHRYEELEADADAKAGVGQRLLLLESELEDMRTKIVCPFCGYRLPAGGGGWCPRCWHGPYATKSPVWNTRPCVEGATATRATYFSEGRFQKNDVLSCLFPEGTMAESLRYTPARQKQIQDARKAEGWTYSGDIIQGHGTDVRYVQGPDSLEKIVAPLSGDILQFAAHEAAPGVWLLDREDVVIDDQKYTSRYTYDAANRIARQQVEYQNVAGCNHPIAMTADYAYENDALVTVKLAGGYTGFLPEGAPKVDWTATVAYTYDPNARVTKEELALTSMNKVYTQRPTGALRDDINKLYLGMRPNRPIENVIRTGDLCATSGNTFLGNPIDLRPFYAMSPNLAMVLPFGVTRAVVTFTYPDSYGKR
ncbi:MAG TPA: tetratricopeptide repeat protein [Thermoanaerobaculia bacterium]|nr:tetratricopeptide repeat protein [Thermoanaerobaculia bacterium]